MLRIRDPRQISAVGVPDNEFPLNVPDDGWYIKHAWDGMDELHFEIPRGEDNEDLIEAEAIINAEQNYFLIKNVDARGNYLVVDAQVDIDAWRGSFWHSFRRTATTIAEALAEIKPTGWTVQIVGTYVSRKTIDNGSGDPMQDVTALDIVNRICDIWGCVVNWDTKGKIIKVIDPDDAGDSGVYLSEDVNLRAKPDYTVNSSDFVTRLYPYGAKDETTGNNITIASVNDGCEYIENGQYSINKIVSIGWTDERYTNPASLKAAAEAKLAELANPVISYTLALFEVDAAISLYQTVTIMATNTKQQVVEYIEYPYRHDLDSVTLSRVTPSISHDIYDNITRRIDAIEETPPWIASDTEPGAVIIGDGLEVSDDGTVSLDLGDGLEISDDGTVGLDLGDGFDYDDDGSLSLNLGSGFEYSDSGAVSLKLGNGLEINQQTGAIDVTGGGGGGGGGGTEHGTWDGNDLKVGGANNDYGRVLEYDANGNLMAEIGNGFKIKANADNQTDNGGFVNFYSICDGVETRTIQLKTSRTHPSDGYASAIVLGNNGATTDRAYTNGPVLKYNASMIGGGVLYLTPGPDKHLWHGAAAGTAIECLNKRLFEINYGSKMPAIRSYGSTKRNADGTGYYEVETSVGSNYLIDPPFDRYHMGGEHCPLVVYEKVDQSADGSIRQHKYSVDIGEDSIFYGAKGIIHLEWAAGTDDNGNEIDRSASQKMIVNANAVDFRVSKATFRGPVTLVNGLVMWDTGRSKYYTVKLHNGAFTFEEVQTP